MLSTRGRSSLVLIGLVAAATGYAVVPQHAAAGTPGMVLGHVPRATAPMNATIVIPKNAAAHGYLNQDQPFVISQGGTLSVVNLDGSGSTGVEHTVTSDATNARGNPLFDTWVPAGDTKTISAASRLAAGTYRFHCRFHPGVMQGTLVVEGGSGGVHPVTPHFTLPLKVPRVLTGSHLRIPIRRAKVQVFPTGRKTRMWTFGGTYPGPTIVRPAGHDTKVTFTNELPRRAGAITVHFHGDHHKWQFDGQPDRFLIRRGHSRTYDFPLTDNGKPETEAIDFYHDHRMNRTAINNWHGLQGMFLVHSKRERSLGLPSGKYDVPLMVADRKFNKHNQLTNPVPNQRRTMSGIKGPMAPPSDATVGNQTLVDGRYAPHLNVSEHRYRLRLLNTSDFTSYDFALSDGRPFIQIGTGNDLLPHPVVRQDIFLGPAQRADVIVDFAGELGKKVVLESIPRVGRPPSGIDSRSAALMQFRVKHAATDHTKIPNFLARPPRIKVPKKVSFTWTFGLAGTVKTGTYWTVNGRPFDPRRVEVEVPLGATETWRLTNLAPITHFIHLHEEQWHTVSRDGKRPPPWERGLEDVWRLDPGESVVVSAHFTDYTGVFMVHCHMLNHEDDGMMAQFAVVNRHHPRLPRGYHLVHSGSAAHVAGSGRMSPSMEMSTPVSELSGVPATGWHRVLGRFGDAVIVELVVLALLYGLRRYWRTA